MDVATMMQRMEGVGAPVDREHDFDRLFREDGPGLWRTMVAFTGGRRDIAEEAVAEAFARALAARARHPRSDRRGCIEPRSASLATS